MTDSIHQQAIREKLIRLYGDEQARTAYEQVSDLLAPVRPDSCAALAVDERDVMLIAYGDHVQDGQRPPLQVLHEFLKETVYPLVNCVHILPFYPYSSDDGFSVIDYYAVDDKLGAWDDISAMGEDFRLMFDAVFNHISARSAWFKAFLRDEAPYKDYFVTVPPETDLSAVVRPRALPLLTPVETSSGTKHVWTTFSDDQIDLNAQNPEVVIELLKILRFYVEKGAQFIRLDAIAFLWKEIGTSSIHREETHLIIQLMRDFLNIIAPDTVLITETNVPHDENISYFGDGRNEAQMVYNFSLPPLVLHTMHTGDASKLTTWAQTLEPVGKHTTFFNFTASHDGIGMRPATGILTQAEIDSLVQMVQEKGGRVSYKANSDGSQSPYELNITYFDAIADDEQAVERFIVSQAMMLALAGVPGIYLHNLFGSRNWHAGVQQTGRARTINREKLQVDDLRAALADETSLRQRVLSAYKQLLSVRRENPAFHPLATQEILELSSGVFAILRQQDASAVYALHNVTSQAQPVSLNLVGAWRDLLSDKVCNGGTITLQPYQVMWLNREG